MSDNSDTIRSQAENIADMKVGRPAFSPQDGLWWGVGIGLCVFALNVALNPFNLPDGWLVATSIPLVVSPGLFLSTYAERQHRKFEEAFFDAFELLSQKQTK